MNNSSGEVHHQVVVDREEGRYWTEGAEPYIVSVRIKLPELDAKAAPEPS
jgi:hypothetical protein